MATSDCFVSVVAPLANDADIVRDFLREVVAVLKENYENYEVVLVDDGSTDATAQGVTEVLAAEPCIRLIRLSRRFGRDIAISAGLDSVIGDFVVALIPESDPPALIPRFIERCRRGAGIVYGIRARRPKEPLYLSIGTRLFYWYFNRVVGVDLPPNSTDYRAYSRQTVNAITRIHDRLRYLRTFGAYVGFGGEPEVYEPRPRRLRPRSRTLGEAVALAINMTVANSTQPLRAASLVAFTLSLVSGAHAAWVVLAPVVSARPPAPGFLQTAQISGLFAVLLLVLATLCEYMGRLLGEIQDRPLYYVSEERNSAVLLVDEHRKNVVAEPD
jgi:glycosyltransferase involved in cell wall biosynthesis